MYTRRALTGLVRGHEASKRKALEAGVVAVLHRLEGMTSVHKVGLNHNPNNANTYA